MTVMHTTCNAQVKKGSKLKICELELNHLPPHQDGDFTWEDNW